jgi:hypothetical protein
LRGVNGCTEPERRKSGSNNNDICFIHMSS